MDKIDYLVSLIERQQNDLNSLRERVEDLYYDFLVASKVTTLHKAYKRFKNINFNKSVACIASGPTAKLYKPSEGVILCGINYSFRLFDKLDYLFRQDSALDKHEFDREIDAYKGNNCIKFYGIHSKRRLEVNRRNGMTNLARIPAVSFLKDNVIPYLLEDSWHSKWAINLETESFGDIGSTTFSALQFLLYTNPKIIYLVGHDCYCYKEDDYNYKMFIPWYREFKEFANHNYPNTQIISINPIGLKGIFEDIYTKEYLESLK